MRMVDHYEQYNRTGRVTRDTGDWTHVPVHVRITDHPERKRQARQAGSAGTAIVLAPEDVEEIRRLAVEEGRSINHIRRLYDLSASRTRRILAGGDPGPQGQTGRPKKVRA